MNITKTNVTVKTEMESISCPEAAENGNYQNDKYSCFADRIA
ncbi:hypothetical protein HMPREF1986_00111 [Oribacterium sp. oral taxon 078 str. F0263]|nr:hypothetical protein HMPREF1986_00111 [Oribacterium sp. oral taxon 078 str. F0263]